MAPIQTTFANEALMLADCPPLEEITAAVDRARISLPTGLPGHLADEELAEAVLARWSDMDPLAAPRLVRLVTAENRAISG